MCSWSRDGCTETVGAANTGAVDAPVFAAARMQNTASGWMLLAHGTQMYPDGTIEWNYSTEGHFAPLPAI